MGADRELDVVRLDVTLFFQHNPHARETIPGVALRVGRPLGLVALAVERLVQQTVLERLGTGNGAFYRYRYPFRAGVGEE